MAQAWWSGNGVAAGVDIGGTKTHVRWTGAISGERIVPTASWRRRDNVADAPALFDLVRNGLGDASLSALGIGAHGCDTDADCEALAAALERLTPAPIRVVNDAELLPAAAGRDDAIGLVVGTGSIAVARRQDGAMIVAGGWGWILGDEGSAPALVREACRAVRNGIDLGESPDLLYDALCASFGVDSFTDFGRRLAGLQDAADWGGHARAVFAAADAGSTLAVDVLRRAARALAELVRRLVERGAPALGVVAGGGVVVAQPRLYTLLQDELARVLPRLALTLYTDPPVAGALAIAARLVPAERRDAPAAREA